MEQVPHSLYTFLDPHFNGLASSKVPTGERWIVVVDVVDAVLVTTMV
jgi:hypothetical protein